MSMFKELIEKFNISRLSYYLETIKNKEIDKKIKAFKKLDNIKISKNMGLIILDYAKHDYKIKDGNGGINSSLVSLCLKNYYEEYTPVIKKLFDGFDDETRDRVLFLLASIDDESALNLYADLVLKYYKDKDIIPVSNLYERLDSYHILFPKLFKALSFKNYKNNILILFNDFLNKGVVLEADVKKNKKVIQDCLLKIFEEAEKYKFTNTFNGLKKDDYLNLRYYLEIATNIEYYVSSRKTEAALKKLFKKHDNQLKIYILENYVRKNKTIDKKELLEIAKDDASRYPLYEFLLFYNMEDLFPKKYLTGKDIAKSDLVLTILKYNGYTELPKNVKFIKTKTYDNHLYYVFTYKYTYINDINYDETTNYILKETGLDKLNGKELTRTFVGVSGGYNINKEVSIIETKEKDALTALKRDEESIDDIVDRLMGPFLKNIIHKISINRKDKKELKKIKSELSDKEELRLYEEDELDSTKIEKTHRFKFGYILLFLFLLFLISIGAFIYLLNNPDYSSKTLSFGNKYKETELLHKDSFNEIDGREIYSKGEKVYYVLLYRKTDGKSKYYTYIDTLLENGYKIYYVNINDKKNEFLFAHNDLNFTITGDRFLKVDEGEFSFYIDGEKNILDELKSYVDEIEKKEAEAK